MVRILGVVGSLCARAGPVGKSYGDEVCRSLVLESECDCNGVDDGYGFHAWREILFHYL